MNNCQTNLATLISNSSEFAKSNKYPSTTTLCQNLLNQGVSEDELTRNLNSSYPIIHHSVLTLAQKFLQLKLKYGSKVEKELYGKFTSNIDFIDRLIRQRPLVFVGQRDTYILRNEEKEGVAYDRWSAVGTDLEEPPLVLRGDSISISRLADQQGKVHCLNIHILLKRPDL